jgi:2-methylisocitrate lyase-like PEP mutase family enzyme
MSNAANFRKLLSSGKMVVAPGAIDCITGRAIAQAGFAAAYMTGAGTSATLGYPDYGLITMNEMVGNASRIVNSIDIPLISDSDTGFGNELNVFRTVQEFERAGVAAIHIEDQVFPKKCGHLDNKELVSREDFIASRRTSASSPAPTRAPW